MVGRVVRRRSNLNQDIHDILMDSLYDENHRGVRRILGVVIADWLSLVESDYDEVDAIYIDHETMGV